MGHQTIMPPSLILVTMALIKTTVSLNLGSLLKPRPNFMALFDVSKESALTEAGNSALTSNEFRGLAGNFCLQVHEHTPHY